MILDRIVKRKQEEVAVLRRRGIVLPAPYRHYRPDEPRGFRQALLAPSEVAIIAEIKKASPSKGVICHDFDPVALATNYQANGAAALSVLTDVDFFQGSLLYLMQAREAVGLPVLRKDFIIDELQVHEARAHGADAVLLIVAILETAQIIALRESARSLGMDVLVEVHDESEVDRALQGGADLIGINNRNLNDFSVDITTTFRLRKLIPATIPVVSESGLATIDDLQALQHNRIDGALIGETLVRAGAHSGLLKRLRGASQSDA